jgi:hypothetical protein
MTIVIISVYGRFHNYKNNNVINEKEHEATSATIASSKSTPKEDKKDKDALVAKGNFIVK